MKKTILLLTMVANCSVVFAADQNKKNDVKVVSNHDELYRVFLSPKNYTESTLRIENIRLKTPTVFVIENILHNNTNFTKLQTSNFPYIDTDVSGRRNPLQNILEKLYSTKSIIIENKQLDSNDIEEILNVIKYNKNLKNIKISQCTTNANFDLLSKLEKDIRSKN